MAKSERAVAPLYVETRTVEVEGSTFEVIPDTLLVRAALIAASQMPDLKMSRDVRPNPFR
jgi:hypothetical protein